MSSRVEKERTERAKQIQDKCQTLLTQMLRDEDNKYCVDCDAKGPRWASWNLGIFLCIRCAGIHRNLGVHISKVKSVNLDSWTPEQVVSLQQMGNSRARAVYEANLPDTFKRPQTDCSLESFIRAKYEHKKYIAREWVPPTLPKVNWDKELDEEAEKLRKRKKENQKSSISHNALPPVKKPEKFPPLPKPKSSVSPKPNRITTNSATLDLLGLDAPESQTSTNGSNSGDDIFTTFLSAPTSSNSVNNVATTDTTSSASAASKSEEESFFNQPAPSIQEKNKMTKDSILALYGAPNQSLFGVPGGMFNQQIPTQQFSQTLPNTGAFSVQQPLQSQMGMPINPMPIAPNQMPMNPHQLGLNTTNNGLSNANMQTQMGMPNIPAQTSLNSNNGWSNMLTAQNLQPAPGSNPFLNLNTQPNQFFNQLPQQITQMSLGTTNFPNASSKPSNTSLTGQTLSTNLWQ